MEKIELTQEELDAKVAEAAKKAADAKEAELAEKNKDKDANIVALRKKADEAEAAKVEAEKKISDREQKDHETLVENSAKKRTGADEAIKKKVLEEFAIQGKDAKTAEEIETAMDKAFLIATGKPYVADVIRHGASGAGGRPAPVRGAGNAAAVPEETKQFANEFNNHITDPKMKITDEDLDPNGTIQRAAAKKRNDHQGSTQ